MMRRLHPGAGVVISWGPDCFPQGITVITTSLNHLAEPELRVNKTMICLIIQPYLPLPQFFLYLNLKLMSVLQRWAEIFSFFLPVVATIHKSPFPALYLCLSL
jgi:hypothetical protein